MPLLESWWWALRGEQPPKCPLQDESEGKGEPFGHEQHWLLESPPLQHREVTSVTGKSLANKGSIPQGSTLQSCVSMQSCKYCYSPVNIRSLFECVPWCLYCSNNFPLCVSLCLKTKALACWIQPFFFSLVLESWSQSYPQYSHKKEVPSSYSFFSSCSLKCFAKD